MTEVSVCDIRLILRDYVCEVCYCGDIFVYNYISQYRQILSLKVFSHPLQDERIFSSDLKLSVKLRYIM